MTTVSLSAVCRKIALRIIPFLFLCYVLNFLDRVNIGFAKLQFLHDLNMSEAVFGIATGFFFLAYATFEIPSNLLLARIGARQTLMRIMLLWGLATIAQMFVTNPKGLYFVRFLLGAAEAGFYPGVILYLSYWFPDAVRARANGILGLAVPIAGIAGGPLSGWIMTSLQGTAGLRGWQWLFLLEGIPAVLVGLAAPLALKNRPEDASWLSDAERRTLRQALDAGTASALTHDHAPLWRLFCDTRVASLAGIYFCVYIGLAAVTFWSPTVLKEAGVASLGAIGWLSGLISLITMLANLLIAFSSDRRKERRWHLSGCLLATAASLVALKFAQGNVVATVSLLAIAQSAMYSVPIVFWTIPARTFAGRKAAAGIALISALGSLGGAASSWMVGALSARTGSLNAGLEAVAGVLVFGTVLLLWFAPRDHARDAEAVTQTV
ncbi:MFS transporter [Paraburkholderia strydomiana]|uniref:MFS transporter n=1 Tax=Paraburkholderia strydomiana TaxID=1245417 RepID=UPI001BE6FAA0|nr:MFS transporter [Paraburkholderia strydomiana]MBT2792089.1 MFS transporter [Paraburkholderia strydomiana]